MIYPGISEKFRILNPAEPSDYSYPPYEFESKEELEHIYSAAKKENLDTLLSKSESIVSKYNDQDGHKIDFYCLRCGLVILPGQVCNHAI